MSLCHPDSDFDLAEGDAHAILGTHNVNMTITIANDNAQTITFVFFGISRILFQFCGVLFDLPAVI